MNFAKRTSFRFIGARALAVGFLASAVCGCLAQSIRLESAGARFGFYPTGAGSGFHQAEGFVNWTLPWDWDLGSLWRLRSRVDASLGWLGESGADAAIATVGPSLWLGREEFPLSFEGGVSPTVLTRSDFITKDFGIPFQFTSHIGINFDIASRIRFSYRFQHMSNASLSRHNPGLNMNMFGVSYLF